MNQRSGSGKLSEMMLVLGSAAFALRKLLYANGMDARGLLVRNSPLEIALMVLTGVALTLVALTARRAEACGESASLPAALGNVAAGAGILATVLTAAPGMGGYLETAWRYLGLAAPVCLLLAAIAGAFGRRPFFLLHVTGCLFFLVHIVTRYQVWSAVPQLQDYVFALLGAMGLLFFSFYTAAREAGCGNARMRLGMGLAAIYFCLAELARSSSPALYLGGLVWVLTELTGEKKEI